MRAVLTRVKSASVTIDGQVVGQIGQGFLILPGEEALSDIIGGIEKGIYVQRLSGGNPSSTGEFSGVAKNSFLIENGKITRPVNETMVSMNMADIIKRVRGISRETANDGMGPQPWIAMDGVTISGK